jgi:hypothetical protein
LAGAALQHPPSAPARWLHPAGRDLHNALAVEARYANSISTKNA